MAAYYIVAMRPYPTPYSLPKAPQPDRAVDAFITLDGQTWAIEAKTIAADTALGTLCATSPDIAADWSQFASWIAMLFGDRNQSLFAAGNTGSVDNDAAVAPAVWRLANGLQAVSAGDVDLSQRRFWRFVNEVNQGYQRSTGVPGSIFLSSSLPLDGLCSGTWEGQAGRSDLRVLLLEDDLSLGDIRAILGSVADEIKVTAGAGSTIALVVRIRQRLFREIERRVGKRAWHASLRIDAGPPSVRDQILAFRVHTGNSPPASAASRPAVGRALFNTVARQVASETICRRETRTDLSHSLRRRTAESCRYQRTRGCPSLGGFAQPPGCRRHRSHYSVAQSA